MMSEEEKEAIKDSKDILKELNKHKDKDFIGRLYYKNKPIEDILQILLDLIEKQQKEIEFYEIQELEYIQGYEDGKRHKQTAVAIKNENAQYELIRRDREKLEREIERLKKFEKYYENEKVVWQRKDYVSKDKIKEKIDLIDKEYAEIIEKNKNDLYLVNINAQRHSAMQSILEELLGE